MRWNNKYSKFNRTRGRRWLALRHVVLVEQPLCAICCKKASEEVDHIKPLCSGGKDDRDNLQGLCKACHEEKTAKDLNLKPVRHIGLDGYPIEGDCDAK